jgi:hypothetical protein
MMSPFLTMLADANQRRCVMQVDWFERWYFISR